LTFYVLTPYTRLTTGLVLRYIFEGEKNNVYEIYCGYHQGR